MSTTTTAIFTGSSQFSNDFQQVITRAVSIASLPIQQMQNDLTTLHSQSSEFSALESSFSSVQSALHNLDSALGLGSFSSSVSDSSVASVGLTGTPQAGTFSIEVADIGAYSSAMSNDGLSAVSDPSSSSISDANAFTLQVGDAKYTITPTANNLSALADAVNRNQDAGVQAMVVNIGPSNAPDYRLSLEGTRLGDLPIQLAAANGSHNGQALLNPGAQGSPVTYRVNGKPAIAIPSETRDVTVAPGVTVSLLDIGTTQVTVNRSTAAVSGALSNFVSAYNSAQSEINKNRGQGSGALKGQAILNTLTDALHKISQYSTGTSGISSLSALGVSFDKSGVLSFDSSVFGTATKGKMTQLGDFLGSTGSGGFLKLANDTLQTLTDSTSGVLASGITAVQNQISRTNDSINTQQDRIDQMQTRLQNQMAAADAAIAQMEQQFLYLSNMFIAMRQNSQNA
jgi:flagellar hook-associated protein 2